MSTMANPAVIAHRGACGYLPEHTLQAVELAHQQGADYLEQDVVLTADGIPIVLHDVTLELTTNVASLFEGRQRDDGLFYAIDFTLAEIKQLTAHERTDLSGKAIFSGRYSGEGVHFEVPTLAEEIELVDALNANTGKCAGLYIELKRPEFHESEGADLYASVLQVLREYDRLGDNPETVIQCFDPVTLKRVQSDGIFNGPRVQLILTETILGMRGDVQMMHTSEGRCWTLLEYTGFV